ncbi:MAG: multiheme c-type cytochrome [Myxococcota bacterium]
MTASAGVKKVVPEHRYVGVKKCRTCHKKELIGDQYGKWREGVHAKALETLRGDKAREFAQKKGITAPPWESEDCLKCHVTAYGVDERWLPSRPLDPADGVQCESCHGPGHDYRKKKITSKHETALKKGLWEAGKDPEICTRCHNDESPAWDPSKFERADGTTAGFDFELAKKKIQHPIPKEVKGHYIELEKKQRAKKRARREQEQEE